MKSSMYNIVIEKNCFDELSEENMCLEVVLHAICTIIDKLKWSCENVNGKEKISKHLLFYMCLYRWVNKSQKSGIFGLSAFVDRLNFGKKMSDNRFCFESGLSGAQTNLLLCMSSRHILWIRYILPRNCIIVCLFIKQFMVRRENTK